MSLFGNRQVSAALVFVHVKATAMIRKLKRPSWLYDHYEPAEYYIQISTIIILSTYYKFHNVSKIDQAIDNV